MLITPLSEAPVLQPYSMEEMSTLTVDAFFIKVAGVLSLEGYPVTFINHTFNQVEHRERSICCGRVHEQIGAFPSREAVLSGNRAATFKRPCS